MLGPSAIKDFTISTVKTIRIYEDGIFQYVLDSNFVYEAPECYHDAMVLSLFDRTYEMGFAEKRLCFKCGKWFDSGLIPWNKLYERK